jgi:hypothetical protein
MPAELRRQARDRGLGEALDRRRIRRAGLTHSHGEGHKGEQAKEEEAWRC